MVRKALITPLRDRRTTKIGDGPDLDVQSNIVDDCGGLVGARSGTCRQASMPRSTRSSSTSR
jgi:hypothetical protein